MLTEFHIKPLAPVIELESRKPVWCAAHCVCIECGFQCVAVVHKATMAGLECSECWTCNMLVQSRI